MASGRLSPETSQTLPHKSLLICVYTCIHICIYDIFPISFLEVFNQEKADVDPAMWSVEVEEEPLVKVKANQHMPTFQTLCATACQDRIYEPVKEF